MRSLNTAEKAGVLPGFRWAVNLPWYAGIGLFLLLAHGGMYSIAYFVEHRVLIWQNQFNAFVYGDIALAVGFGAALYGARRLPDYQGRLWQRSWLQCLFLVICLGIAVFRWAINDYQGYSVGQSASPTKLYHDLLFMVMGYLLLAVLACLLGAHAWRYVALLSLALCAWAFIGLAFDQGALWKMQYAHTDYDWPVKDFVQKYIDPILRH